MLSLLLNNLVYYRKHCTGCTFGCMDVMDKIRLLPEDPGVYQFRDAAGEIVYIGKAKNLRKRVSSYFMKHGGHTGRTRVMLKRIQDVTYIVVANELDALLLENSMIKQYQPRYNVALKDDKSYPWLCIVNERFPRVFPTRQKRADGSDYYGPYASVRMMKTLLDLLRQLYYIRTCKYDLSERNIANGRFKVCLEYHIGNCLGPCEGLQTEADYQQQIADIKEIIKGNINGVIGHLEERMRSSAEQLRFEEAQLLKDKIEVLKRYRSKSTVVNSAMANSDVLTAVSDPLNGYVNYMKVVDGSVIRSHTMHFKKGLDESDADLLEQALAEVRSEGELAREVLLSHEVQLELQGHQLHVPQRGDKKKLIELSRRNASYYMLDKQKQSRFTDPDTHTERLLEHMQRDLRLKDLPRHIECFDNSNFQGAQAVAACVVFKDAKPSKKDYRHFTIKTVQGPDDFASMREVVYRRYRRQLDEGAELPQLILIDGGKGQLSAALESLDRLGLRGKIAVLGIAKKLEELYFPGDSAPLYIDKRSETLKVLQHLRNEAHRFGISHHRNKRSKESIKTSLTDIPGIGYATAQQLLQHFKSVAGVRKASLQELTQVVGAGRAGSVKAWFELDA